MTRQGNSSSALVELVQSSSLSQEIKDNATLLHHFNEAGLAIGKKDYDRSKSACGRIPQRRARRPGMRCR